MPTTAHIPPTLGRPLRLTLWLLVLTCCAGLWLAQPHHASAAALSAPAPQATPTPTSRSTVTSRGGARPVAAVPVKVVAKVGAAPVAKIAPAISKGSISYRIGTGHFIWPAAGRLTQGFSKRHDGIDIAAPRGTPLHAADSGEVVWAGWRTDGLGYAVIIDHHNGYVTVYGHQMRRPPVRVGQYVRRGQVIGYMGSTGHSTGPHVHFIIRTPARHYYNPLKLLGR
ncbi:MAG: M23 family metallopeptidase [Chloroflexota bacterium]|nr:M23 family metallopeptidase [Chloroflexota bacterium]